MKLIVLAAGKSSRIYNQININKCLIKINNQSLLMKIVSNALEKKINHIDIIVGFKRHNIKEHLAKFKSIKFIYNKKYKTTDMVFSSMLGLKKSSEDTIICYSDILFEKKIFDIFKKNKFENITVPYIKNWKEIWKKRKKSIFEDAETFLIKKNKLINIGNKITKKNLKSINGQFMGIIFIPKSKLSILLNIYNQIKKNKIQYTEFLNFIIQKKIPINVINYKGKWYEFDDINDLNNFKKNA